MIITIHCGGLPFNGDTIKQKSLGGSETSAYYVAKELAARGHRVTVFTSLQGKEGIFDGVKYIWHGPTHERAPLGELFHFYATNTPHDVLIVQRQPGAFVNKFASKLNVVWLHDLALYRQAPLANAGMWNVDAVFTVSEWHKEQVCKVYGYAKEIVRPVQNGIDLSLFEGDINGGFPFDMLSSGMSADGTRQYRHPIEAAPPNQIKLLYASRPERGLEHHVREGGIMDRLRQQPGGERFHLYVCNYEHVHPSMAQYYSELYGRIEQMPNVTMLGHLTKRQLASIMRQCDALVYPTEFEDTSCILAMEAMAAGLPFISSESGALPETCKDSGSLLIPLKDGKCDEDSFIEHLRDAFALGYPSIRLKLSALQLEAAKRYEWKHAVDLFEKHFEEMFAERTKNPESVLKHLIHLSDYYAAEDYRKRFVLGPDVLPFAADREMAECYAFARDGRWKEHYEDYYEYEKQRGVVYGPEDVTDNNRYRTVTAALGGLGDAGVVLDYGCAHGHYSVNLAKQHPHLTIIGIDLAASNIEIARKWAKDDEVKNVRFYQGEYKDGALRIAGSDESQPALASFDAIIAAEVLEHVESPWALVDGLGFYLKDGGKFITTTPLGPWEAVGYKEHWPWRAHVHHLERDDLHDLFGMHKNFRVNVCTAGADKAGDALGSYVCTFDKPTAPSGRIDYKRKLKTLNPRQTLSVCLIAKDAELTIAKCLASVDEIADEIIVAVDSSTKDATREIARKYARSLGTDDPVFDIPSPLEVGFEEARNRSIAKAKGDWIMWIDADEFMHRPQNVLKYLRQNQYMAYAMKQIHYSADPATVLKVDLPSRLFRNNNGIRFYGMVHEHPEIELNKGIGHITVIEDAEIAHFGYSTEDVRRGRFNRNIDLLVRDREKYPDRTLGKLLWMRDLAQMSTWELEHNGGVITPEIQQRARIGIKMWEELLELGQLRMLTDPDNMRFYSTLVQLLGEGFEFGFKMDVSKLNGGAHPDKMPALSGRFASRAHAEKLFTQLLNERTRNYDSKYF